MILSKSVFKNKKEIKIEDLSNGSHILVLVKCDYCDNKREIPYKKYTKSIENNGKYSCSYKCRSLKTKEINLDRFGVNCNLHSEDGKSKVKKTMIDKYGVDNFSKSSEFLEKTKKTNVYKYGTEHFFQSDTFKNAFNKALIEKYGVDSYAKTDEFKDRYKNTCIAKYGVSNIFKSDEIKNKIKNTFLKKYGVDSYTKTDEFKECIKNHNLNKYDVEYFFQSEYFKEKLKKTNIEKYGTEHFFQSEYFKEKFNKTLYDKYNVESYIQSEEYRLQYTKIANNEDYIKYKNNLLSIFKCNKGHNFEIHFNNYYRRMKNNISLCTICNPIGDSKSIKEKDLFEFINNNYSGDIIQSYRDGLEIDIYLPELNIGFEFNGLYWHSDKFKEKNYHLDKTNHFKNKGIRIIHIWEDDWVHKQEIVKSQISNIIGCSDKIYGRKCIIKEVDTKIARKFLDDNHIQGFVSSVKKIGLYYDNELVSIMTFDHNEGRKKMSESEWNLSRFCNKIGFNVIGGASKLLKFFIDSYYVSRIVSYADKDWSVGKLYYKLEFKNISESKPDYKYIVDNNRVHKSRYKKSRLGIKDKNITESQKMKELNINKIYDCGKIKFERMLN